MWPTFEDRISELPDFIVHEILSFLSAKEVAKTSILSKRWYHIWETFPVLHCDQLLFGKYLDLLNPKEVGLPIELRRNIFDERENFSSHVDDRLQRVLEKDICLKKFGLVMTLVSLELFSRVDSWLERVSGLSVQEIELRLTMGKGRFYALPMKVLASPLLTILSLKGCSLIDFWRSDVKHCSLVELHLQGSLIDEESIQKLVSSIQSLEVLSLKDCLGFTELEIKGHEKLKKIVYHSHKDLKVVAFSIWELPNLEELEFWCVGKPKQEFEIIGASTCPNVKRLSLSGITISAKSLQNKISSFRLLERLFLGGCVVTEAGEISSPFLKEVYVRNCIKLVNAEFDTPASCVFRYHGKKKPYLSIDKVAGSRLAELSANLNYMDSSWFMEMNIFVSMNKFQDLILSITAGPHGLTTSSADQDDDKKKPYLSIDRTTFTQPYELKSVRLVMHGSKPGKYAALLDGLLWKLRPKTLSLELTYNSPDYIKGLLKSLVAEEDPVCYCWSLKCWRHSLKYIKLGNVKGFQAGTPLDLFTLSRLNDFLNDWAIEAQRILASYGTVEGEILSFDMSW